MLVTATMADALPPSDAPANDSPCLCFADLTVVVGRIDVSQVFDRATQLGLPHIQHRDFGRAGHFTEAEQALERLEKDREKGGRHLLFTDRRAVVDSLRLERETYGKTHGFIVAPDGVWRNLTASEVNEFFASYEVGIMHISDILRVQGLWS